MTTRTPAQQAELTDAINRHRGTAGELVASLREIRARGLDDIATAVCLIRLIQQEICPTERARVLAAAVILLAEREHRGEDEPVGQAHVDRHWGPLVATTEVPQREQRPSLSDLITAANAEAEKFNTQYPPGTLVEYWRGAREGDGRIGRTKGPAFASSSGQAVVFIDNSSGYNALSHVRPLAGAGEPR